MIDLGTQQEKVILCGVGLRSDPTGQIQDNLNELALLCETAGGLVVGITSQKLERIVSSTFIGKGKVEELAKLREETGANLVIIDAKLSGAQQRNLHEIIKCRVIDRSQLIIDIFAQRARTREGQLQVELAQLKDQLPRLIGEAIAGLSKLAGGIGTRGPGETKLEMDRRKVKEKIEHVTKELEHVRKSRALHRSRRKSSHISTLALVGYTNSGKSTLLNVMTNANVVAENKLFVTLDPTTRKLFLPSGRQAVITDTVGFINKLPTHLIEAFKATFEEIKEADMVLHVHDSCHPLYAQHAQTVIGLLAELEVDPKKIFNVYNKMDLIGTALDKQIARISPFVNVSALTGTGLKELVTAIEESFESQVFPVDLYLPTSDPRLIFKLARDGKILSQESGPNITHCKVELSEEALQRWSEYLG